MFRGDSREDEIGVFCTEMWFNMKPEHVFWSLTHTHTHEKHHFFCFFTPDMSSLCFSTEDIHTGPGRTSRTVGPAGTAPASSTGTWTGASSSSHGGGFLHVSGLFLHVSSESAVRASALACVTLSFTITSVLGFQCSGWVGRWDIMAAHRHRNATAGLIS